MLYYITLNVLLTSPAVHTACKMCMFPNVFFLTYYFILSTQDKHLGLVLIIFVILKHIIFHVLVKQFRRAEKHAIH